VTKQFLTKGNL